MENPDASETELEESIRSTPERYADEIDGVGPEDISVNKDGRVWTAEISIPIETFAESTE
jgi:hypothetical protein